MAAVMIWGAGITGKGELGGFRAPPFEKKSGPSVSMRCTAATIQNATSRAFHAEIAGVCLQMNSQPPGKIHERRSIGGARENAAGIPEFLIILHVSL